MHEMDDLAGRAEEPAEAGEASGAAPPDVQPAPAKPPRRRVALCEPLAFGVGAFVILVASLSLAYIAVVPATLVGVIGLGGMLWALVQAVRIVIQRDHWGEVVAGAVQALLALPFLFIGTLLVLIDASGGFRRGRQLRRRGALQLPPLGRGTGWATLPGERCEAPEAPALAAQWRENGRTEHASVAAFARLSLDLLGLGAPARLLKQAQADALDEIRHAELCFSLARDLDGSDLEPVAFPAAAQAGPRSRLRSVALVELAIDSLVEGALHEGLSARVIAQLARLATQPRLASMLTEIAADEGRHAAHAWDVLEWCIAEGGPPVRAALRGALRTLPDRIDPSIPDPARDGSWLPFGVHSESLEADAYIKARAFVIHRTERLLAQPLEMAA